MSLKMTTILAALLHDIIRCTVCVWATLFKYFASVSKSLHQELYIFAIFIRIHNSRVMKIPLLAAWIPYQSLQNSSDHSCTTIIKQHILLIL
jgi:hypothetical protein